MPKRHKTDPKELVLKREGALNPHPETVSDPLFKENAFFDPRDLVQVRYEMLRRQRVGDLSVVAAAEAFGVSRPTFYQAQTEFAKAGLLGLLPKHRGPKHAHKLSEQVVDYILEAKRAQPELTTEECLRIIKERFGITVHRRSLERALGRKKKRQELGPPQSTPQKSAEAYEVLRSEALCPEDHQNSDSDRILLMRHGMAVWIKRTVEQSLSSLPKQKPAIINSKYSPPQIVEEVVGLMAEIIIKSKRRFTAYA